MKNYLGRFSLGGMKMKKVICFVLVLVVLFSVSSFAEEPVYFVDANLKAAVEAALGKTSPTPTDMLALTYLYASECGISDPTGLEYATNLTYLYLRANQISDISPLASLTNLNSLDLTYNQISDISPLAGLTNLSFLSLRTNQISDISPLTALTNLVGLDLSYNQISDINPLAGLTNLVGLLLYNNQISDISPLTSLTNLDRLWLYSNQISDISPLAGLTNLVELHLYYNQISDISPLAGLTDLVGLHLYGNQISDISPLAGLTNLMHLNLDNNQISNISPLAGLMNLWYINLSSNQISNISPLAGMANLHSLYLPYNQISDIRPLAGLTNLEALGLYHNQISDISPLAGLTGLWWLFLANNQIGDISPLAGLSNLVELHLYGNQISDISPLAGLTGLGWLLLANNQISDISDLSSRTNLYQLNLTQNPLNCPAYDVHIPLMETNNPGIYLTYDPRPAYCDYQPDIDVSPVVYDFGDVELEIYRSVLITISNTGNGDLTVESLAFASDSSLDFMLVPQELPAVIPPEGSIDVAVLFAPTTEELLTAVLEIGSNDYDEAVVQVSLWGLGVVIEVPPDEQIIQIIEFIETSVAEGTLEGVGPGKSAGNRLNALINMLESTSDLIVGGYYDDAYTHLVGVLKKCDGQVPPPDFVDGEAREELADKIMELMEDLVEENISTVYQFMSWKKKRDGKDV